MVGDLVNRGPSSLEVLRWARAMDAEMGDRFQTVLGNHDLHLIRRRLGIVEARPRDTLKDVLEAADGPDLVEWLRRRPLVHFEHAARRDHVLVHAGLLPGWSAEDAREAARRLEGQLRSSKADRLLRRREGKSLVALTRMRMLDRKGRADEYSGAPEEAPGGLRSWFDVEPRGCPGHTVVCGHWAALGARMRPRLVALDSGCVWGAELSAVRLDDRLLVQTPCVDGGQTSFRGRRFRVRDAALDPTGRREPE